MTPDELYERYQDEGLEDFLDQTCIEDIDDPNLKAKFAILDQARWDFTDALEREIAFGK